MNNIDLFIYLIKCTISFSLLYGCYRFIFNRTTFFQLNRIYLLSIIPLSLILPVIKINKSFSTENTFYTLLPEININSNAIASSQNSFIDWSTIFWLISLLFVIRYLIRVITLIIKINRIKKGQQENTAPFSFFNYIHIPKDLDNNSKSLIIAHEQVHAKQAHSIDILIYESYKSIFWFNPLVWLTIKDVKANHEFIADSIAAKENTNHYSKILVAQLLGVNCSDLVNNFNTQPLITKRIKMMKTQKTHKLVALSYSLIAPIAVIVMLTAGSIQVNAQPANTKKAATEEKNNTYEKVDQMPEFKGGTEKLITYLGAEIKYPEQAKKANEQGTVFISFVIDEKGKVTNPGVEKGVSEQLDAEALRVVSSMPDWTPGKDKNKLVSVKMVLPIKFQL